MKTNFEKLKELPDYIVAQVMDIAALHVDTAIPPYPGAQVSEYDHAREYLKWLRGPFDEKKGFKFILDEDEEEPIYISLEELEVKKRKKIFKGIL